ncbi:type II toxin-antitoxin system RelE/ParE family toxin [Pseudomonas putida]|uniref:Type II toxin-antitoxin system RelE/ParE family toxin n=1 Tax=Pseudomonas putida TaxID=303 RepID=A0ABD7BLE5_PSEPU|nr:MULTISPECIES: type II toxin-antitoxin system RelE/ParE family toxin [Pseudomonas]MBH3448966.1 type II toxin-antitoxin system RelE/ParE family toxin [Pseudomonas putida]QOD01032.1 type II toxin-antitoxin system RelE/ParE family toxin [Pseudomonas putida]
MSYYLGEQAEQVALGFIDALENAYIHISRHPASGMPLYVNELNLSRLLYWPRRRYPYLMFYVERVDHVDEWRVLHGVRDIPGWLVESLSH